MEEIKTGASAASRISGNVAVTLLGVLTQGCMDATILEYQPLRRSLDGRSELHISTYPAGFPRETFSIPFLYKALRTPESVYFQVYVRDVEKKVGANSHIKSIRIRSFTYQFPEQEPVTLISDFDGYFWMQESLTYNTGDRDPVPYSHDWYVHLNIELAVNGQVYQFHEKVNAAERRNMRALLLYALD